MTEEQFNEFNGDTNIDEFIAKYLLERVLALGDTPDPEAESMRVSLTRASINISAHDLPAGGMHYYGANGNYIYVQAGKTFKITAKWTGGPVYGTVSMGYYDGSRTRSFSGNQSGGSASFKFTTDTYVAGYMKPDITGATPYHITSGSMSW